MKKTLVLFLFISTIMSAQYSIKGSLQPAKKYSWVLLYKVEGVKKIFIKNTQIKKEIQKKDGKNITVGNFEFELPIDAKIGSYRVTYDAQEKSFVDFLFNKEDVSFSFDPDNLEGTTIFSKSKENQLHSKFMTAISFAQKKIDSLQIAYLKTPTKMLEESYKRAVDSLSNIQNLYSKNSYGTLAYHFINAAHRYNSLEIIKSSDEYFNATVTHFFDKIDFSNSYLYNSSFLVDRLANYVFYMHHSKDTKQQEILYKKAVDVVIEKIKDVDFKTDVIQFLISQFASIKNLSLVGYLLKNHFEKLPKEKQDLEFKKRVDEIMSLAAGKMAPNFSWTENGKETSIYELNDGQSYLLVFYSTECSHCLREIPKVFKFMKGKNKTKVIAFALETSDKTWKNYKKTLPNWHHVLGLEKWENKIARTYQVTSTPTYFVLGMDKKIIANPQKLKDLEVILENLN